MSRPVVLAFGGLAVAAAYAVVVLGIGPDASLGPVKLTSIALPGMITGIVMAGWVLWEMRRVREERARTEELSTQLVRKEIELSRLATIDELTGLYTRREFDELLRLEFERARRHGRELSLLLLEIDDIAELGEHVGSLSKGFLLAEVSGILKHVLRTNDLGCRYTNDSLAMLLPETGAAQARVVAGKIRMKVAEHDFLGQMQQGGMRLTVSQGIAVAGAAMNDHHELSHTAEQALAEARAAGFDKLHITAPPAEDNAPTAA